MISIRQNELTFTFALKLNGYFWIMHVLIPQNLKKSFFFLYNTISRITRMLFFAQLSFNIFAKKKCRNVHFISHFIQIKLHKTNGICTDQLLYIHSIFLWLFFGLNCMNSTILKNQSSDNTSYNLWILFTAWNQWILNEFNGLDKLVKIEYWSV